MFDDPSREAALKFDGHFDQLVEVVGADLKHLQYPGKCPANKI